jgi:hypothetical protein
MPISPFHSSSRNCVWTLLALKVSADRREPETSPIYFKSRFLTRDHPGLERQIAFEAELALTGLFEKHHPEPKWADLRAALEKASEARPASRSL